MLKLKQNPIIYAPNVHSGGGFILLKALLEKYSGDREIDAILDIRCKNEVKKLCLKNISIKYWVKPYFLYRIISEIKLFFLAKKNSFILCFHNIPPILCKSDNINIYFQNKLIIEEKLKTYKPQKTLVATKLERLIIKVFYNPKMQFITQSYSTKLLLKKWIEKNTKYSSDPIIMPFIPDYLPTNDTQKNLSKKWDFLYISSGDAHKNVPVLFDAWRVLDEIGLKPSLALTISQENQSLTELLKTEYSSLNIVNLGQLSHTDVLDAYTHATAFIHPSTSESFGLTLLEATNYGLPILAPELDYVRDVCTPAETFDPQSALSIARAIMRFMNKPHVIIKPITAKDFWSAILLH